MTLKMHHILSLFIFPILTYFLLIVWTVTAFAQNNPCGPLWKTKDAGAFNKMKAAVVEAQQGLLQKNISGVIAVEAKSATGNLYVYIGGDAWKSGLKKRCSLLRKIMDTALNANGNIAIPIDVYIKGNPLRVAASFHDSEKGDYFEFTKLP